MYTVIINGVLTGLILQLAIGPVFIYVTNIVFQKSLYDGLFAVLAVSIVDYLYILFAIFGVGKLLENNRFKKIFGCTSAVVLIFFGIISIITFNKIQNNNMLNTETTSMVESFVSAFILTISSPLTILFWTGLFTTKSLELNLSKNKLYVFGISAGFATILFLGTSVIIISKIKNVIPLQVIFYLNILVGIILIIYGIWRLQNLLRTSPISLNS